MLDRGLLRETWEQALKLETYVESMEKYQKRMRERLASVRLDEGLRAALNRHRDLRHVLVLTEDWCGDAIFNLPIVARLVEAAQDVDLRVAYRHRHEELQASLSDRGINKIPVVIFMTATFQELAIWEEQPEPHKQQFKDWKRAHPRFLEIKADPTLSEEERSSKLRPFYTRLLSEMYDWYDGELDFQGATIDEILDALDDVRSAGDSTGAG